MRIRDGFIVTLVAGFIAAGCASGDAVTDAVEDGIDPAAVVGTAVPPVALAAEPGDLEVDFVGSMELDTREVLPGSEVAVTGTGLPVSEEFELAWFTVDCNWVLEGEQHEDYLGRQCRGRHEVLDTVQTDASGALEASFVVPDDYGFGHDVGLIDAAGVLRNKALIRVGMQVSVTPESGPVGTPITIEVKGMGWQSLEDTRTILYDNRYVGFMSAVTTRGTARATIPATGAVGPHHIEINRGAYTFPYLNPDQSPRPDILTYEATFTITDGAPVLPDAVAEQNPVAIAQNPSLSGPGHAIATDLVSGPVGTPFRVVGQGFEPGELVILQWFRIVGNRVGGAGWEERAIDLGQATTGGDGTFEFATEVPGDVGGSHRIEASQGDVTRAETSVAVTPAAEPVAVTSVPWGTQVTLHLTGVGWTETANIYTIVYDNAYMGYACGFNTQGDVQVSLTITGDLGWHFVELYPAIYKGDELPGRDNFRIPQLTALDDHPGEALPIFRYAFQITGT